MSEKQLYRWTGQGVFRDHRNNREIETGETIELDPNIGDTQREMVSVEQKDRSSQTETQQSTKNQEQTQESTETQQQTESETTSNEEETIENPETQTEPNDESTDKEKTSRPDILKGLTKQDIRDMEYGELQQLGKQFEDIDASGKMEEIEDGLIQKL